MPVFFASCSATARSTARWPWRAGRCASGPTGGCRCSSCACKSGRIWYAPGFAEEQRRFEKWPALLGNIRSDGRCTPILGPGLTESLLGSRREIAQRWAETYHFPMAPHDREDLPQVAQYLAVNQDADVPPR